MKKSIKRRKLKSRTKKVKKYEKVVKKYDEDEDEKKKKYEDEDEDEDEDENVKYEDEHEDEDKEMDEKVKKVVKKKIPKMLTTIQVQTLQPSLSTNKLPIQVQSLPTNKLPIQVQTLQPSIPTNKLPIQVQTLQPSLPTNKLPIQVQTLQLFVPTTTLQPLQPLQPQPFQPQPPQVQTPQPFTEEQKLQPAPKTSVSSNKSIKKKLIREPISEEDRVKFIEIVKKFINNNNYEPSEEEVGIIFKLFDYPEKIYELNFYVEDNNVYHEWLLDETDEDTVSKIIKDAIEINNLHIIFLLKKALLEFFNKKINTNK
jgi:hypothetical protein